MFGSNPQLAVLTVVHGYTREHLYPFLNSLQRSGYSGRVVFFHSQIGVDDLDYWRRLGVETVPFGFQLSAFRESMRKKWWAFRWWPSFLRRRVFRELCCMAVYRHIAYLSFLEAKADVIEHAMLADARDLVFQASPFPSVPAKGVHLFEEDASQTLGTEPFNRHWLDYYFDRRTVDAVRTKPIICAGTIIGEVRPLLNLLRCVVELATTVRRLGSRNSGGDQVILNVAVRQAHGLPLRVHRNGEAAVLNAGIMSPEKINFNSDGWVVNTAGEVISVVHQLDRHPRLNQQIVDKVATHSA